MTGRAMRLNLEGVEICAGDGRERWVTRIVGAGADDWPPWR
jgi:hypothetical protein